MRGENSSMLNAERRLKAVRGKKAKRIQGGLQKKNHRRGSRPGEKKDAVAVKFREGKASATGGNR